MKTAIRSAHGRARRGSAVLIVLVLLAVMTIIMVETSRTLAAWKDELKLLDQQQQRQHGQSSRN